MRDHASQALSKQKSFFNLEKFTPNVKKNNPKKKLCTIDISGITQARSDCNVNHHSLGTMAIIVKVINE